MNTQNMRDSIFGDIPLKNAMLAWNENNKYAYGERGKVMVIPHPDKGYCNYFKLANTVGACMVGWEKLTKTQRLAHLFIEAWFIVCRDNVSPKAMHDALMVIPEYRDTWSGEPLFVNRE